MDMRTDLFIYLLSACVRVRFKRGKWQQIVNCDSSSWEADSRTQHRQPVITRHVSLSLSLSPIRPVSLLPGGVFIWYYWCVAGPGPGCDVRVSRMLLDVTDVSLLSAPFIWLHHRPDNCNLRLSNWLLSSEAEQGRGWNFLINNPSS